VLRAQEAAQAWAILEVVLPQRALQLALLEVDRPVTRHLAAAHARSQEALRQRLLVPQVERNLGVGHAESHVVAAPHLRRIPPVAFQEVLLLENSEEAHLVPLGAFEERRCLGPLLLQMGNQVALDPQLPKEADRAQMGSAEALVLQIVAGCRGELNHRFYPAAYAVCHVCGGAACCEVANG